MESTELLLVCGAAFLWVFTILVVLALLMRLIIIFFPGTKIIKIEEKK
jgi:uncharacterized membrane protein YqiK